MITTPPPPLSTAGRTTTGARSSGTHRGAHHTQHCFRNDDGVRVHEQESVRWEDHEMRFESRLLFPHDEHPPTTYLQLSIENLRLTWRSIDAFLPIATARRLRDQLTSHLDAAGHGCLPECVGEAVRGSAE